LAGICGLSFAQKKPQVFRKQRGSPALQILSALASHLETAHNPFVPQLKK